MYKTLSVNTIFLCVLLNYLEISNNRYITKKKVIKNYLYTIPNSEPNFSFLNNNDNNLKNGN